MTVPKAQLLSISQNKLLKALENYWQPGCIVKLPSTNFNTLKNLAQPQFNSFPYKIKINTNV